MNIENLLTPRHLYELLCENSNDFIILFSVENGQTFRYVDVNKNYTNLIKRKKQHIIGKLFCEFLPDELVKDYKKVLINAMILKQVISIETKFNIYNNDVNCKISAIPVLDINQNCLGIIVLGKDDTERIMKENELLKMKEIAQESARLKSSLLSNLSHEIRTPMSGILGFAQLLKEALANSEYGEMAELIHKSGNRLLSTLTSIIELSMLQSANKPVYNTAINLNEFVIKIAEKFRFEAERKNLYLNISTSNIPLLLHADEDLLSQVINNLIDNAIKFTQFGGINIILGYEEIGEELTAILNINDTGIGISDEYKEIIFHEFRQISEGMSRKFEGTGLGLTLAKKITELMNGKIYFESELSKGSKFSLAFPVINKVDQSESQTYLPSKNEIIKVLRGKPNVLLVEDNDINRKLMEVYLKDDYEVKNAIDLSDVFSLLTQYEFKAILMDINLGKGMNGIDITKRIRSNERYRTIPIIAITGYALKFDKAKMLENGFNNFLAKPFEKKQLHRTLSEII